MVECMILKFNKWSQGRDAALLRIDLYAAGYKSKGGDGTWEIIDEDEDFIEVEFKVKK